MDVPRRTHPAEKVKGSARRWIRLLEHAWLKESRRRDLERQRPLGGELGADSFWDRAAADLGWPRTRRTLLSSLHVRRESKITSNGR